MDEPRKSPRAPSTSAAVLVIDDNDIDRQVIHDLLADAGYRVSELPTAIGATRMAREIGARAVVIDQNLPALDGAKLAALFRSNPSLKHIKLILISSNDEGSMASLVRESRADAFVSKMRMHTDLVPTVRRVL